MRAFPFFLFSFFLITSFRESDFQVQKTASVGQDTCILNARDSVLLYRDAVYLAEKEVMTNPKYRKTLFVPEKLVTKYYEVMTNAWCTMHDSLGDLMQQHFFVEFDPDYFNSITLVCNPDSNGNYPDGPDMLTDQLLSRYHFETPSWSVYLCERGYGLGHFTYRNVHPVNLVALNTKLRKIHSTDTAVRNCCFGGADDSLWQVEFLKSGCEIRYSIHKTGPASNSAQYTLTRCTSTFFMEKGGTVHYKGYEQGKTDTLFYQFLIE